MINMTEAVIKIRQAGAGATRAVPMPGLSVIDGDYQIEINEGANWVPIITGIKHAAALQIINQALTHPRVICG